MSTLVAVMLVVIAIGHALGGPDRGDLPAAFSCGLTE